MQFDMQKARYPLSGYRAYRVLCVCVLDGATCARTCVASLECTALVFAHCAPYSCVLAGFECPGQAFCGDGAPSTDDFGIGDLRERRTTVSHREK